MDDERYMRLALKLAKKAEGMTSPNPMVGAVLVKSGRIVGKGYHRMAGFSHAEVNAIKDAGSSAKGATLYVALEPCDHFGRTGPCTDAIINSGIKKAVIAMKDPNKINNGRGIRRLRAHGIRTVVGVLENEARLLNRAYVKFVTKALPYVTVKIAESIDGKIATRTGDSRWITGEESRRYVHGLRAKADAVLVGANTVLKDDPMLISKITRGRQPVRVIVEGRHRIPKHSKVIASASAAAPVIIARNSRRVDLTALLKKLAKLGIINILVEGGGEIVASLIDKRLVDRFLFFISPKIVGGRCAKTAVEGNGIRKIKDALYLGNIKLRRFGNDILVEAEVA